MNIICTVPIFSAAILSIQPLAVNATELNPRPVYSAEEVAWSRVEGVNAIVGVAMLGSGKKATTCATEEVWLRPRSAWEDYRSEIIFGNLQQARIPALQYFDRASTDNANMPASPKEYDADARKATCTADGKFTFAGVPDGEYYISVIVQPLEFVGKITPIHDIEVVMHYVSVTGGGSTIVDLFSEK
jgi:hypothetical protein